MKTTTTITDYCENPANLIGAIVNYGADALLVEDEQQAEELAESILRAGQIRQITDDDEFEAVMGQLDLNDDNKPAHLFSAVDGSEFVFCLPDDWQDAYTLPDLRDIAELNGLEVIETTSERNGYPCAVKPAVIGFRDWDQAVELCESNPGTILITVDRRDGWNLWHRGDQRHEPLVIRESDYSDDYNFISGDPDEYIEFAKSLIDDCDTLDDRQRVLDNAREIVDALNLIGDDEVVLTCQGEYEGIINTRPMEWSYDTQHWAVALIAL